MSPLSSEPSSPGEALADLMPVFRGRWEAGGRIGVEAFLEGRPGIGEADLLYLEVVLREGAGELPDVEEYVGRYPARADPLRKQFALHQVMADAGPGGDARGSVLETAFLGEV